MKRWLLACAVAILAASSLAHGQGIECWDSGQGEQWGPRITCVQLTEQLLIRLQGAERREVVEAMGAPGRPGAPGWLHYESDYDFGHGAGTGFVNFHFNGAGHVDIIAALVDGSDGGPDMEYIWNAHLPGCSDFPNSKRKCN